MASALEQLTQGTTAENPVSFTEYYNARHNDLYGTRYENYNPYGLGARVANWFSGDVTSAKQEYDNYLTSLQTKYNTEKENTAIQRQFKDAFGAGLNPLALLVGNAPSGASSSAAAEFSKTSGSKSFKSNSLITSALKLLAILAIKG